ncbi:MAG: hypothetical protein K2W95_04145 [Candidatus Obscuribacterales bacterium]|nr:hypothetical protein [Candidatus Obscuribacterales bacterium]
MKSGLKEGNTAELEITVTADMLAHFENDSVYELYSTSDLIHHMERAARQTILPYLDDNEAGVGCHVNVSHRMLTLCGMKVLFKATVTDVRDRKVECEVEAFNARGKLARGTVVQAIVEREWLEKKMREMSVIANITSEPQTSMI